MLHCCTAWVTGRLGQGREDRQESTVEMELVKNPSSERERLLRAHASGRAPLVPLLWQKEFGSVRNL